MKTMLDTGQKFVFLGSQKGLFKEPLPPHVFVCHDRSEVEAAVTSPTKHMTWISFTRNSTDMLLEKAVGTGADLRGSHLITLTPPRSESISALLGLFHPGLRPGRWLPWLPKAELVEVITRDDASDRFIGGSVDPKAKTLTLLRGDIEAVVAPLAIFQKSGDGTTPDFTRLQITDYRRAVALGDYGTSADAILYKLILPTGVGLTQLSQERIRREIRHFAHRAV